MNLLIKKVKYFVVSFENYVKKVVLKELLFNCSADIIEELIKEKEVHPQEDLPF